MTDADGLTMDTNGSELSENVKMLIAAEVKKQLDGQLEAIARLVAQQFKLMGGMRSADPIRIPTDSRGLPVPR